VAEAIEIVNSAKKTGDNFENDAEDDKKEDNRLSDLATDDQDRKPVFVPSMQSKGQRVEDSVECHIPPMSLIPTDMPDKAEDTNNGLQNHQLDADMSMSSTSKQGNTSNNLSTKKSLSDTLLCAKSSHTQQMYCKKIAEDEKKTILNLALKSKDKMNLVSGGGCGKGKDDCSCHSPCPVYSELVMGKRDCCKHCKSCGGGGEGGARPVSAPPHPISYSAPAPSTPSDSPSTGDFVVECYGASATEEDAFDAIKRHLGVVDVSQAALDRQRTGVFCRVVKEPVEDKIDKNDNAEEGDNEGKKRGKEQVEVKDRALHEEYDEKADDESLKDESASSAGKKRGERRRLVMRRSQSAMMGGKPRERGNQIVNLYNKFKSYMERPSVGADSNNNNEGDEAHVDNQMASSPEPLASPRTGGASMPTLPNRCQSPDQSLTSPISQPIMISTENGRRCTGSETPTPLDAASASTVDVEVASSSTQSSPSTLTLNFDPKGVVEIPLPDNVVVRCVNGKVVFEKLPTVTTPTAANTTSATTTADTTIANHPIVDTSPKNVTEQNKLATLRQMTFMTKKTTMARMMKTTPTKMTPTRTTPTKTMSTPITSAANGKMAKLFQRREKSAMDHLSESLLGGKTSQRRVAKYEPTSLKEAGELLAKSSGSGASLALALKFERWALVAMREGDASLTKQLLRAAIIHHPDPNAYIQRLQNTQIPELGPNKATEL